MILFELCWIFTNLACGTSPQVQSLIENGAIPCLMSLLTHPQDDIRFLLLPFPPLLTSLLIIHRREQSVWALANISGHTDLARDPLLAVNILDFCLECLNIDTSKRSLSAYPLQFSSPAWALGFRMTYPMPSLFLMQHFTNLFANLVRYHREDTSPLVSFVN
jgi:hypothetical protein